MLQRENKTKTDELKVERMIREISPVDGEVLMERICKQSSLKPGMNTTEEVREDENGDNEDDELLCIVNSKSEKDYISQARNRKS